MTVEPFTVHHQIALTGPEGAASAITNQISGPAFALVEDKKVVAIGGVRVLGIGEAWAMLAPGAPSVKKTVLRTAKQVIDECIVSEKLYRIYADATVDKPAWFKHLGFVKVDNIYMR